MNLRLKVYRDTESTSGPEQAIKEALPWRWVIVDLDAGPPRGRFAKWFWAPGQVVDHGRRSDFQTALRVGLYVLGGGVKN